jgi:hypothetical protein
VKRLPFFLLVLASCGGNVVVDGPSGGHGGVGGTTATGTTGTSIDVSSSSVSVSSGTGTNTCGTLHISPNATCEHCAQATCCAQLLACDHGTPCGQIIQCLVNCAGSTMACTSACTQKFPAGVGAFQAVSMCLTQCPSTVCEQPVATVCDSGLVTNALSCDLCLTVECCAEAEACAGDPLCTKCFDTNAPPSCGGPTYAQLHACKAASCPVSCP